MSQRGLSSSSAWWTWRQPGNEMYSSAAASPRELYSARGSERPTRQPPEAKDNGPDVDSEEYRAKLAAAKMMSILKAREKHALRLDVSVYAAAIIMPQIARSAGWPKNLTIVMIRSYIFLLVNYFTHGCCLYFLAKEELVWDAFAGQMFLCDFGKDSGDCPGAANCIGPAGTEFAPARVYSWSLWPTRMYVRDSLKGMFPDRIDDINRLADPGEYGLESYYCRLLCCALYTVTVMSDLMGSINIMKVFMDIPNKPECWVGYEEPTWADKERAKAIHGWTELDLVTLKIAGMSLPWKILNVVVVLLPKVFLWKITAEAGTVFLMETSAISDLIVNSVALAFILQIDALLCAELMSETTRSILEKLDEHHLEDYAYEDNVEEMPDKDLYTQNEVQIKRSWNCNELWDLFPLKFALCILLTWAFTGYYYQRHCAVDDAGGKVSISLGLPLGTGFNVLNAFMPRFFPILEEEEPLWVMPET